MADPKDDAVFKAIDALKLDDNQKADLFDAYHAGSETEADSILKKYVADKKIPGSVLNNVLNAHRSKDPTLISDIKPTTQPPVTTGQTPIAAPPAAATPPVAQPGIMERATKNASRSLLSTAKALSPAAPIEDAARTLGKVAEDTATGYKQGGVGGAVLGAVSSPIKQAVDRVSGAASHIANRVMHPMESFAEDPFGTIVDIASAAIPEFAAAKAGGGITGAVRAGTKSAVAGESIKKIATSAKDGFTPKQTTPVPAKSDTRLPPKGLLEEPRKTRFQGTADGQVIDVKATPVEPPIVKPEAPPIVETSPIPPPIVNPTETAMVKKSANHTKQLPAPKVKEPSRFYGDDKGQILDVTAVPTPVEPVASPLPKQLDVGSPPPKQLESPKSDLDTAVISQEVNAPTTVVDNMGKLSNEQLSDIISQYDQPGVVDFHAADFDPIKFENIRQVRNAAKAVLKKRSEAVYPEGDLKRPLDYTPDMPATPASVAPNIPTKSAVVVPKEQGPIENPVYPKEINSANKKETVPTTPAKAPEVQAPSPAVKAEIPPVKASVPVAKAEALNPVTPPVAESPVKPNPVEPPAVEPVASTEIPMPRKSAPKPEPVKEAPKVETAVSDIQVIPRNNNSGKANYREGGSNGSYALEADETLVTRKNAKDPEILDKYVVKVNDKGVSILDEDSKVIGKYNKGTSLEDAISDHFGLKKSESVSAPIPDTKVKSTSTPETKVAAKAPTKQKTKSIQTTTQSTTPPSIESPSIGKALKDKLRVREVLRDIKKNGASTKEQLDELHGLVGEKETETLISSINDPEVNTFRIHLDVKTPGQKIINQEARIRKVNPNKTEIDVSGSHNRTGDNMKETFSVEKDGDRFVVIDKSRKRIASYIGIDSMDEAVKLATEKLKTI